MREHVVRLPAWDLASTVYAAGRNGAVEVTTAIAAGGLAAVGVHVCFGEYVRADAVTEGALEAETPA